MNPRKVYFKRKVKPEDFTALQLNHFKSKSNTQHEYLFFKSATDSVKITANTAAEGIESSKIEQPFKILKVIGENKREFIQEDLEVIEFKEEQAEAPKSEATTDDTIEKTDVADQKELAGEEVKPEDKEPEKNVPSDEATGDATDGATEAEPEKTEEKTEVSKSDPDKA